MTTARDQLSTAAPPVHRTWLLAAMVLAVAGYQLNATMLTPALPDLINRLHTTSGPAGLAQTLFFLTAAIGQVTIARLSDYRGRRRMMLATLVLLLVGEVMCLVAPSIEWFIAGRMLEGVASATFALAYLILHEALPPRRFGRALGIITAINGGIAGVDVIAGGWLADTVGFRGIFGIGLVITVLAAVVVYRAVPDTAASVTGRMDWPGATLLALGLATILMTLNEGSTWGWSSPRTLGLLLGGLAALVLFVLVERRAKDAIIDTAALASRQGWPLLLTTVLTLAGAFGMLNFTIPLLTQTPGSGFGMSATWSALVFLTPASALGIIAAPIAGHLAPRIGWRRSVLTGSIGSAIAAGVLMAFPGSPWIVATMLAVLGITYTGYSLTTLNGLAVEYAPKDKPGSLPGINGACFGIGASLGIALASGAVTGLSPTGQPTTGAFHAALWTGCVFLFLALATALLIRPGPATDLTH